MNASNMVNSVREVMAKVAGMLGHNHIYNIKQEDIRELDDMLTDLWLSGYSDGYDAAMEEAEVNETFYR